MSFKRSMTVWRSPQRASSEATSATIVSVSGNEVSGFTLQSSEGEAKRTFMKKNVETGVVKLGRLVGDPPRGGESLYKCRVVSKDHAIINFRRQGGLYVTDTGSTHGSSIVRMGVAIPLVAGSRRKLANDDVLVLGKPVENGEQITQPLRLTVKFIYHSRNSPEMQTSSPNRYVIPINVGDTSESDNDDSYQPRAYINLPERAKNSLLASPSPLRGVLPLTTRNGSTRDASPASSAPIKRPKLLDDFMNQIEGVKAAIDSVTAELGNIRVSTSTNGEVEKQKFDELQSVLTGFHEQQERWAKDHEEQMALIRSLKQKMEVNSSEKAKEPIDVDGDSEEQTSLKRKAPEPRLDDLEPVQISAANDPREPEAVAEDIQRMETSPMRRSSRRRRGVLAKTATTLGTFGLGAAMMWYGLSEMPI